MTLDELVLEAINKSADFKNKMYWRGYLNQKNRRKKPISLKWLMPKLEDVLGKDYVRQAAEKHLASFEPLMR